LFSFRLQRIVVRKRKKKNKAYISQELLDVHKIKITPASLIKETGEAKEY
jgi:hypothetical protein